MEKGKDFAFSRSGLLSTLTAISSLHAITAPHSTYLLKRLIKPTHTRKKFFVPVASEPWVWSICPVSSGWYAMLHLKIKKCRYFTKPPFKNFGSICSRQIVTLDRRIWLLVSRFYLRTEFLNMTLVSINVTWLCYILKAFSKRRSWTMHGNSNIFLVPCSNFPVLRILQGLKTGMYYLRTKPAANAIQFTVDKTKLKATQPTKEQQDKNMEAMVCSLENPDSCTSCSG